MHSNFQGRVAPQFARLARVVAVGFIAAAAVSAAAGAFPSPNALLTIDQNRAAVVDGIVADRGPALIQTAAGLTADQLRAMLMQLRADQLLAARMAGSLDGVRDVLARSLVGAEPINPALLQPVSSSTTGATLTKAIGDGSDDVVYTPVVPCRLVETRGTFTAVYQGDGTPSHNAVPFNVNEVRTYTVQAGNSACTSQLPSDLGPVAVQLQVFGMPTTSASGDIEILPQGAAFGSTATEVFVGSIAFNTVSTVAKINTTTNQISVKVTGGHANLAMDVVGYFKVPGSYGGTQTITGVHAVVAGGYQQTATGPDSFIGGGDFNTASGGGSVVVGGDSNTASGDDAAVLGGSGNTASATTSTVAGGWGNIASGLKSFAAGYRAQALQDGEFVWADDSTDTPFEASKATESIGWASAVNTFNVRATGGAWFVTGIDSGGLPTTGVNLPAGSGSWTSNSDRAVKENFHAVDDDEVLRKVAAMPVTSWNYIAEGASARHLGPMAQDFYAAFGLGQSERSIATVDESGIALAAIKALYARARDDEAALQKKDEQIRALQDGLDARAAELRALARKVDALQAPSQ
jgi:Chaperone of endosialidase